MATVYVNGTVYTDVYKRQVMEAAIEVKEECGYDIVPEIMIPLIGEKKELKFVKDIVVEVAEQVKKEKGSDIQYHIGTMIEIPRAALTCLLYTSRGPGDRHDSGHQQFLLGSAEKWG